MKRATLPVTALLLTFALSEAALAYVGPGAGLSLLGALWGLLLAVGTALAFVIIWPLKRARRRARERQAGSAEGASGGEKGQVSRRAP